MPSSKHNRQLPDTRTPVYIDILPESSSRSSSSSSRSCSPSSPYESPQCDTAFQPSSSTPRRMRDIDPTVTFVSPSGVIGKSSYIILLDGAPIHSEDTKLDCIGPYFTDSINPSDDGPLLYSTALVPKYWEILCKSPDPTMYSIIQEVYRAPDPPAASPARSSGRPRPVLIFSATYHFRYPVPVCTPPSSVAPHSTYQANSPITAHNTHTYSDLIDPICPQNHPFFPSLESDQEAFHEYSTQNQLYEQFVLNVSLGDFSLDDFSIDDFIMNIHDSSEATSKEMMAHSSFSSFPKDICNYVSN
ncbi:hypothetical protein DFH29DRAFT_797357 [Suillus ampliporus]|nr:hypothetical protein DFH29DRAFT_797357 [Suillus ampliporus]